MMNDDDDDDGDDDADGDDDDDDDDLLKWRTCSVLARYFFSTVPMDLLEG